MSYEVENVAYVVEDPFTARFRRRPSIKTADECIEELKEEIAYYKSELGLQIENTHIFLLTKILDIRPGAAYFIMALFNAKCRVLMWEQLLDLIPGHHYEDEDEDNRGPRLINTYAATARKVLGERAIETAWATGYCMTTTGKSRVLALLNPVEQQVEHCI